MDGIVYGHTSKFLAGEATSSSFDSFDTLDWLVFGGILSISLFIGIFFGCIQKQSTTSQLLVGGRNMSVFATAFSLASTFISYIDVIGIVGEIYSQGTLKAELLFALLVFIPLSGFIFLPTIFKLELTSTYEYVELRFKSKALRLISALTFIIVTSLYMGIILYVPALTLEAVSDCPLEIAIIAIGLSASVLSSAGGFEAVVWSDIFQVTLMVTGMLAIIIKGTISLGGFEDVFEISNFHGRIDFFIFKVDPLTNVSSLNVFFGMGFLYLSSFGCSQARVQRFLGLSTVRRSFHALFLSIPVMVITTVLAVVTGLVVFANYSGCDPLSLGFINQANQIAPYFVLEFLSEVEGLLGLFVAFIFSGALSQVASGINTLAACTWEDFLKDRKYFSKMSEGKQLVATKTITFAFGLLTIAMSFVARELGDVHAAVIIVNGTVGGPLLGTFLLGVLCPFANSTGTMAGIIVGHIVSLWVTIGGVIYKDSSSDHLPYEIDQCSNDTLSRVENMTLILDGMKDVPLEIMEWPEKIYSMSYLLYPIVGTIVTFAVGSIVSVFTGRTKFTRELEPYIHPWVVKLNRKLCSITNKGTGRPWIKQNNEDNDDGFFTFSGSEITSGTTDTNTTTNDCFYNTEDQNDSDYITFCDNDFSQFQSL